MLEFESPKSLARSFFLFYKGITSIQIQGYSRFNRDQPKTVFYFCGKLYLNSKGLTATVAFKVNFLLVNLINNFPTI